MDSPLEIVPMSERRYEEVAIAEIKVINSRDRDLAQFEMNVQSIEHLGVLKPIRVNDKFYERSGFYELICGEGRLLAHEQLEHSHVMAEVVTCTRKDAYLQSLIENIARTNPRSMDFARELKRLRDEGWTYKKIAVIACQTESYIKDYIRLVEQGEERLISGVEQGIFPIKFAIQVAATDDSNLQNVLMDAFDEGLVTTNNFAQARKIVNARAKSKHSGRNGYTVNQLKRDIVDATKSKTSYVREAKDRENRFLTLLTEINDLWEDAELTQLITEEELHERPELAGDFSYGS